MEEVGPYDTREIKMEEEGMTEPYDHEMEEEDLTEPFDDTNIETEENTHIETAGKDAIKEAMLEMIEE